MNGVALVRYSLRRTAVLLAVVAFVLAGFQWLMTLAARALESMGAFEQILGFLPPAFRAIAGPALVPLMSFGGMVTVGYFHLIVLAALMAVVIGVGTEVAGEVEHRVVDLLLSRPVWRGWLVLRSLVVLTVAITTSLGAMVLGTWSGLVLFAPPGVDWPAKTLLASMVLNLGAEMCTWGAIALAVAAASKRRVVAGATVAIAALVSFLVDYIARLWDPLKSVARLSPFHYLNQMELLTGTPLPLRDIAILAAITAAAATISLGVILRRDL
jgi:ABC-2 type transport system permease protein